MTGITTIQYKTLDEAVNYFNKKLFDGKLPDVFIIFQRKPRMAGHLSFERLSERDGKNKVTELALNPDMFYERTDIEILSDMVHEMVHLQQHCFGNPPRKSYHDREWGDMMKAIGLYPSKTGEPGGKETGQSMDDYIIEGGKFEIAAGAFLLGGKKLLLESIPTPKVEKEKKRTRWKWTCPVCMTNVWGKKDLHVACGDCGELFVIEEED